MEGVMAGVLGMVQNRRAAKPSSGEELLKEIDEVRQSLDMAAARFDFQSDPDLLEACIYEMQALNAKYRYLTREARRMGLTRSSLINLQKLE